MSKTKLLALLLGILLVALVLVACTADDGGEADTQEPVAQATEPTVEEVVEEPMEEPMDEGPCAPATEGPLAGVDPRGQTITWWHNHDNPSRVAYLDEIIPEFNSTNECGITVIAEEQGSYNDIRDKVNASINAGELPAAIVVGYQNDQAFYQLNNALADLNVFVDDPTWGLTAEERADFFASFFNQSIHPAFGGQHLGFPPNRSIEVLYYNQTWLEELGFDGPPTTPDEFRTMACAAAEANGDGTGGYILSDSASAIAGWAFAFGGDILSADGTEYTYNSDAVVESMQFLKGLQDDGCAFLFTEGYPDPQFATRKAIFTEGSSSGMPYYQSGTVSAAEEAGREPDVWGIAALPHTTADPVVNVYGGDVMITANTPEQELASWIFIKYFTSPEIQAGWAIASGYFPTRAGTVPYLEDYMASSDIGAQYQQALDLLPYGAFEPQLISYQAVRDAAEEAFNAIMQGADIETTLNDLTVTANELQEETMAEIQP